MHDVQNFTGNVRKVTGKEGHNFVWKHLQSLPEVLIVRACYLGLMGLTSPCARTNRLVSLRHLQFQRSIDTSPFPRVWLRHTESIMVLSVRCMSGFALLRCSYFDVFHFWTQWISVTSWEQCVTYYMTLLANEAYSHDKHEIVILSPTTPRGMGHVRY